MRQPIREAFSDEEWEKISLEILAFNHSVLYQAFRHRINDRVLEAQGEMEKADDPHPIFHYQGRVKAHKRDIMIFEDLLETARKPSIKRNPKHGRSRTRA